LIKNIVFDLGRVLLKYEPKEYLEKKINKDKVDEIYDQVFRSEEWVMLDRGVITQEEAVIRISKRYPENKELIMVAFKDWYEMMSPIEGTVQLLYKLKKAGYNIYYLSNFQLLAFDNVRNKYDFFKAFNGGIFSYMEKLLKPEIEIYKCLIERYSLLPSETIFTDDMECNIDGCKKIGIGGILFTDPETLIRDLKVYGVEME